MKRLLLPALFLLSACNSGYNYAPPQPQFAYWFGKGSISAGDTHATWQRATTENKLESAKTWAWIMDGSRTLTAEEEVDMTRTAELLVQCFDNNPSIDKTRQIGEDAHMCFGFAKSQMLREKAGPDAPKKISFNIYPLPYRKNQRTKDTSLKLELQ